MRERGGQQAKSGYQHGHHNGAQTKDRALDGGFNDVLLSGNLHASAACAQLVDVFKHNYTDLHRDAEEREEANCRGNGEVGVGDEQGKRAAHGGHDDRDQDEHGPLERAEHGVQD